MQAKAGVGSGALGEPHSLGNDCPKRETACAWSAGRCAAMLRSGATMMPPSSLCHLIHSLFLSFVLPL